jgi:hypothetical protein
VGSALAIVVYALLLALGATAVWRRPVVALYLFVVGLAVHNAAMAGLYGAGVRGGTLTAIQGWKDVLLAVALARVALDAVRARRLAFRAAWVDASALLFAAFVVVYALIPQDVLGGEAGARGILYALRHDLEPVAAFFLGRALALRAPELRRLGWTVLAVAGAVATVGLVEEYALSLDWWARHGATAYFRDQLGFRYNGPRDLPENFVFNSGNEQELARRLVSTFLSPLAASYLFVVALLVAACARFRSRFLALALAGLAAAGLLFTFSRSSLAALALGLCVVAVLRRRRWPVLAAVGVAAAGLAFAPVFPDVAPRAHWTPQELKEQRDLARRSGGTGGAGVGEASTRSHLTSLREGARTVAEHPQGFGLGNAGETASRTHTRVKAGESTYTELGVETGLLGALAFVAWSLLLLLGLVRSARSGDRAAAALAASMTAVLALAVQTDVLGVPWLALCLWWAAGSLVSAAAVPERAPEASRGGTLRPWRSRSIPAPTSGTST